MSTRAAAVALTATLGASACAHGEAPHERAIVRGPADPAPARSIAREHAPAGEAVGLTIANDRVRARAVVLDLLEALGRADAEAALAFTGDPVARTLPRIGPRAQPAPLVVRALIAGTQPASAHAAPHVVRVLTLVEALGSEPLPEGLAATDLVVEVDLRDTGVAPRIPAQSGISSFIVRPGPPARVVGL